MINQKFSCLLRDYAPESVALFIEDTVGEILSNRNTGLLSVGAVATDLVRIERNECPYESIEPLLFYRRNPFIFCRTGHVRCFYSYVNFGTCYALVLPVFGQQIGIFAFSYLGLEGSFLYCGIVYDG